MFLWTFLFIAGLGFILAFCVSSSFLFSGVNVTTADRRLRELCFLMRGCALGKGRIMRGDLTTPSGRSNPSVSNDRLPGVAEME